MLKISSTPAIASAIAEAVPEATLLKPADDDPLALDAGVSVLVAFKALIRMSKAVYASLKPYITARPEMEIEIEGPNGKIRLKLKNVTEQSILDSAEKVMAREA
jgi:hypothetical protein